MPRSSHDFFSYCKDKAEEYAYYSRDGKLRGYATRKALHKMHLAYRAAHVFVFNKKGELFLQHRAPTKDVYPNRIAPSASGHLEINETPKKAAIRELKEELGIHSKPLFLGKIKCFTSVINEFLDVFMVITTKKIRINRKEIRKGLFKPFSQVYKNPHTPKYIPAMQKELMAFRTKIVKNLKKQGIKIVI